MIVSWYCPTNINDETDITTFYNELSSLAWHISKYHVLIVDGDTNGQIGKDKNNKFCLHNQPNKNSKYLADFFPRELSFIPKYYVLKKARKTWPYTYPNNAKSQLDYILKNKKCIKSALNYNPYPFFEGVSSYLRIASAKISPCPGRR